VCSSDLAKAIEALGPLGFAVTDETASPAALDDEIEVLADELVALNDALGEKKTTVAAIRAWARKTFKEDLSAQAEELKKRVADKRAKVASLSPTA
jgi:predicted phosphohydrolase